MSNSRFEIAGVKIDAVNLQQTVDLIDQWIREKQKEYIVLTGAHGLIEMQDDPELRAINNAAGLTTPDGMPIVWIGRARGYKLEKVYAPNVMNLAFELGVARGHKHFLYGGRDGVADKLKEILEQRFSGIQIVGTHCPPFRELTNAEAAALAHSINESGANVVWCGLGCPKQEHWMKRFRPLLDASVLIGVGAGFDFLSGEKPLAPRWIQHSGFEWAFRLVSDPARLWPRYSRVLPRFIYHAGIDTLRRWLP